ncbi:hypothetical protein E2320_022563, partial [Naja naja]
MRNLAANVHQILQQVQVLTQQMPAQQPPQPATPAQVQLPVAATLIPKTPSCLPQRFTRESDKMRTLLVQFKVFIGTRPREFPMDRSQMSTSTHQNNDPVLDNFQNFLARFRQHLGDRIRMETADHHLCQLHQGNTTMRTYIEEFKLLATDLDWNEPALISQFRSILNRSIAKELIRQGIPRILEGIFLVSVMDESRLAEIWALSSSPYHPQLPPPITTPSLPTTPDLEGEEPMQIGTVQPELGWGHRNQRLGRHRQKVMVVVRLVRLVLKYKLPPSPKKNKPNVNVQDSALFKVATTCHFGVVTHTQGERDSWGAQ